jgi:N-acetylglucosamine-6-sulfatase
MQPTRDRCRALGWIRRIAGPLALCLTVGAAGCSGSSQPSVPTLPSPLSRQAPAHPAIAPTGAKPRRPNIVFVLTDDLSLDLLRFMPHVLAMKRHGLTFKDYFVSDSLCCPSRASILTGRFPHNTRILSNTIPVGGWKIFHRRGEQKHTFNIALQHAGYLTAMMGKYLNGYLQEGRHKADGAPANVRPSYVPPGWNEWDVAGWGYPEFNYRMNIDGSIYHFGHQPADYLTDVIARRGVRFIHAATALHRPFFLELASFAPHGPYVPAPRDAHDFPGLKAPEPQNFNVLPKQPPRWLAPHKHLTPGQIALINRVFRRRAQSVQAVDRMIGQIEQALAAGGVSRDTYVVFSSDNGLHTGEYRLMPGKLTAFNTDIRVPLIVTGPGIKPDSATTKLAENVDLAETFSAIAGARFRGDGHSLTALLHGRQPPDWRDALLVEHHSPRRTVLDPDYQQPASGKPTTYEAIRTRAYLYVEYADGELEFYDLYRDPFELDNIASRLSFRQLTGLHADLHRLKTCRGPTRCWAATHLGPLPARW